MPKSQSEMIEFRVRNVNAAKQVWQPSGAGYQQPSRDHFGNGEKKTINNMWQYIHISNPVSQFTYIVRTLLYVSKG